jgi:hypothetical protein
MEGGNGGDAKKDRTSAISIDKTSLQSDAVQNDITQRNSSLRKAEIKQSECPPYSYKWLELVFTVRCKSLKLMPLPPLK